ncbi:hypothetical protein ES708_10519 [subsurface metagenome]
MYSIGNHTKALFYRLVSEIIEFQDVPDEMIQSFNYEQFELNEDELFDIKNINRIWNLANAIEKRLYRRSRKVIFVLLDGIGYEIRKRYQSLKEIMTELDWTMNHSDFQQYIMELKDKEKLNDWNKALVSPKVFRIPKSKYKKKTCSVMMPFSPDFDDIYEIIKSTCQEIKIDCIRADDIWNNEILIQDIFELLYKPQIIIVDFTGRNSNVFYETGIAHTLGKIVIPISQDIKDVPFDLQHLRVLEYKKTDVGLENLKKKLHTRISTILKQLI